MEAPVNYELEDSILSFFNAQCEEQYALCEKAYKDEDIEAFNFHKRAYEIVKKRLFKEADRIKDKLHFGGGPIEEAN